MNFTNKFLSNYVLIKERILYATECAHSLTDCFQITATQSIGIFIKTQYQKIKNFELNNKKKIEIIVYSKNRKGIAVSNSFEKHDILHAIKTAIKISSCVSYDVHNGLPQSNFLAFRAPKIKLFYPNSLSVQQCADLAFSSEDAAFKTSKRIKKTEGSSFYGCYSSHIFGNSYRMFQSYKTSYYSIDCSVIAENEKGMEKNFSYTVGRDFNDLRSPQWVGNQSSRRALARLNPKKLSTSQYSVILSSEVACDFFHCLSDAIDGHRVYQKSTFLLNSLKKRIFPKWLNIHEDPHLSKGLASCPFDREGVKTKKRNIVKNGILQLWLLDNFSAKKLNLSSNGHAGGAYNWKVSHQNIEKNELIQKMGKGIIVTQLMGQGINILTGDYSQGIFGFWVQGGTVRFPIKEMTISGNLKKMFRNILGISNDVEKRKEIQCGSILFSSMVVSGF